MYKKNFIIKIINEDIFYGNDFKISLENTNFPNKDSKFKTGLEQYWLTEIVNYDNEKKIISLKIVDYHYQDKEKFYTQKPNTQLNYIKFLNLQFNSIEPALFCYRKFDFIDIAIDVKIEESEEPILSDKLEVQSYKPELIPTKEFYETVSIDFDDIKFNDGKFLIKILPSTFKNYTDYAEYGLKSDFSKKEFQSVHKYFKKHFGKRVRIQAKILYKNYKSEIVEIVCPTISNIDNNLISEIRYDYILDEIKSKRNNADKELLLLSNFLKEKEAIIKDYSPQEFVNTLFVKNSFIHHQELKYLADLHNETNKYNLEFVIKPEFGFLFYIGTNGKNNFILETYKVNKATYIWSNGKNEADFKLDTFYEIVKNEITKLFDVGRLNYRRTHTDKSFTYIEHSNLEESGFKKWKEKFDNEIGIRVI